MCVSVSVSVCGVCVCVDLYVSEVVLMISNKLIFSDDSRYGFNTILFNSDAIIRTYQH